MGDRAITVFYVDSVRPIPLLFIDSLEEHGRLNQDLAGVGLLSLEHKGSYPGFVIEDLCCLEGVPDHTVAVGINDSGDVRYFQFENGSWSISIVPTECMSDEDLYNKWLEQSRIATQKDAEIRRLKYEISVLKGKLP